MAHLLLCLSYSIRQRIVLDTSAHSTGDADGTPAAALADVSIRQHTSAYVSIRQHTSADADGTPAAALAVARGASAAARRG